MGVYFPGLKIPTCCAECGMRDPEWGGACELMPHADFKTFDSQFACCPLARMAFIYGAYEVQTPHGPLCDVKELMRRAEPIEDKRGAVKKVVWDAHINRLPALIKQED